MTPVLVTGETARGAGDWLACTHHNKPKVRPTQNLTGMPIPKPQFPGPTMFFPLTHTLVL